APSTCTDVGVILRGPVEGGDDAGRAREAAIANACEIDKWPAVVVDCVTSNRKPDSCLAQLGHKQRAAYDDKLAAWTSQYGGSDYGGEDADASPDDAIPEVSCADVTSVREANAPAA